MGEHRLASLNDDRNAQANERLTVALGRFSRLVVAFSGGADSALLAWAATRTLGREAVLCVTAVSPSLAPDERAAAAALAQEWNLRWIEVATTEMDDPAYVANGADRCARCKTALMDVLEPLALEHTATVALGVNLDDLGDHRPGQAAAEARGAVFPLVIAGLSKDDVRAVSRAAGLRTWDKPAAACVASRVPYGTPVTLQTLDRVTKAESGLRRLGFEAVRVRHYGDTARIEVPIAELDRLLARRTEVVAVVSRAGYHYVTLDLEGLRSGNLNDALSGPARTAGGRSG